MNYFRQLDAIRGIGILLVIGFHWLPVDALYNTFPNRPFGVDVFFVLSGFLISRNLFIGRKMKETEGVSSGKVLFHFYFRRALRILPLYYFIIFLIVISHQWLDANFTSELIPALTYTLNFHFYHHQYWGDLTTHLWTLAIEEQFYLLWPLVLLFLPERYLLHGILVSIGVGIVGQLLITDMEFGFLPTYTCLDAFGIGALMAWVSAYRPESLGRTYHILQALGIISSVVLIVASIFPESFFLTPQRTVRSLVAAWAICYVVWKHHRGEMITSRVFNNPVLLFFGKISYGMYMYHIFFPWMYVYLNEPINQYFSHLPEWALLTVTFAESFTVLVVVSWLSWKYFERPLLFVGRKSFRSPVTTPALSATRPNV